VNDVPKPPVAAEVSPVPGARPSGWRRVWRLARILAVAYLGVLLLMVIFENSLIYFPSVYPDGYWSPHGLDFEDAWFEAADGTKLHGWHVARENPRAVVLIAHGNAGNVSDRADLLADLVQRLGASALIFDYRGYGRSDGTPSEQGILADARAARRWLADKADVPESQIVLMGESLGGGVMVDLAAKDGARGLVLENTFNRISDVAAFHYPWLPVRLLMRTRLDSESKIGAFHGPLLQVHGDADRIVPLALAKRLFEAAHEPKRLVVIRGGDHNDPRRPAFYQALDQFFAELPPAEPTTPVEATAE
jgi:hypothetical protein